jgi:hypothetical protein
MATFTPLNSPQNPTMRDFHTISSKYGGLAKGCRHIVRITPVGTLVQQINSNGILNDMPYLCETAEYPGRAFNNVDLRYYGANFKLPYQSTFEDINLTFLCRNESIERQFFDDWMTLINPTKNFDFSYRDDYKCRIDIFNMDISKNTAQYSFTLQDAYPILVNPQPVTWAEDQFLRLGITFTYHWWYREGRDTQATSNSTLVSGSVNVNVVR